MAQGSGNEQRRRSGKLLADSACRVIRTKPVRKSASGKLWAGYAPLGAKVAERPRQPSIVRVAENSLKPATHRHQDVDTAKCRVGRRAKVNSVFQMWFLFVQAPRTSKPMYFRPFTMRLLMGGNSLGLIVPNNSSEQDSPNNLSLNPLPWSTSYNRKTKSPPP